MGVDDMMAVALFLDKTFDMHARFNVELVSISAFILHSENNIIYFIIQQCFLNPQII